MFLVASSFQAAVYPARCLSRHHVDRSIFPESGRLFQRPSFFPLVSGELRPGGNHPTYLITTSTFGGHRGPPYQSRRVWSKFEILYSRPYALCLLNLTSVVIQFQWNESFSCPISYTSSNRAWYAVRTVHPSPLRILSADINPASTALLVPIFSESFHPHDLLPQLFF